MPNLIRDEYVRLMRPLPPNWPKDIHGIPFVKKQDLEASRMGEDLFLCNIKNANRRCRNKSNKIVHSFSYDYQLRPLLADAMAFLYKTAGFKAISTPDLGMHPGMEKWQIIEAVGKSRWFCAYCQSLVRTVLPTVGWVFPETYDICFSGLEDGSTFLISSLGVDNKKCRPAFLDGLAELRRRFPNSRLICVGNWFEGIPKEVVMVPYEKSFGNGDRNTGLVQGHLFNQNLL